LEQFECIALASNPLKIRNPRRPETGTKHAKSVKLTMPSVGVPGKAASASKPPKGTPQWTRGLQLGTDRLSCFPPLLKTSMTSFPSNLDYEAFRNVVEALVESGQAVSIFDADDNLR
jgi:hypothetical protein